MHIAANAATAGEVSDEHRAYLANLVATRTGVRTDEAQKRVDAFIQTVKAASVKAKTAADEARKSAAAAALYTALALLIGAFIASVSAAIGVAFATSIYKGSRATPRLSLPWKGCRPFFVAPTVAAFAT